MRINMNEFLPWSRNTTQRSFSPTITKPSSYIPANSSAIVTISDAARHAASADNIPPPGGISTTAELRSFIKQYDFHNTTPTQMATLAGELRKRGEISNDAACSFIGVETNTIIEMDPNKPIDMVAHFKMMLDTVENAARSDPTLSFAVSYSRGAYKALEDVMSFANSDRPRV